MIAVYDYLIKQQNLQPEQIISYGHSLGAAIATELAVNRPVAGLVLESPFITAFRVQTVYPLLPFDKFANIDKISRINTAVFILHSRDDPIIPFWHGETLFEKAITPKKALWIEAAGHSGITRHPAFWPALADFLAEPRP